jgi:hypothetical protein
MEFKVSKTKPGISECQTYKQFTTNLVKVVSKLELDMNNERIPFLNKSLVNKLFSLFIDLLKFLIWQYRYIQRSFGWAIAKIKIMICTRSTHIRRNDKTG